ncbi:MAG TPA: tetratricopeptide repeat protein [Propionibacteriaceae bacterium]|nr:tetratricopeptide repeat protein [Propionibacteriaceae bacterium]
MAEDMLADVVKAEAGMPGWTVQADRRDDVADARQNMWRWAGNLDQAAVVATEWDRSSGHQQSLPVLRVGEIRFLQGRYDDAAAAFDVALRRGQRGYTLSLDTAQARLNRGAALLAGGRTAEGLALLRGLAVDLDRAEAEFRLGTFGSKDDDVAYRYAVLAYYTRLQLGDAERRAGEHAAALEDYDAARNRLPLARFNTTEVFPGALHNNEALALAAIGRASDARAAADRALATDPLNPVFLLTAGSAAHQAGVVEAARDLDARALAHDPTLFPAANNLGVALAAEGRERAAASAFRRAVGARADYATAWFNLGVLNGRRGPLNLLAAQGAYAQAFALDPTLAARPRHLILDERIYETGLDLSKPVPPGWGLGQVERRQPIAALGLLTVVSLVLASSSAATHDASGLRSWLETSAQAIARVRLIGRRRHVGWAVGATVVTFGIPMLRQEGLGVTATVAYLAGIGLLVAFTMMLRQLAAFRAQVRPVQRAWPPGLLVGVVGGAAGVPWAPLPYLRVPARAGRIHLVAPIGLGALATALLLESATWPVPFTRALAIAALVMTASVALPVRPLDGQAFKRAGILVGLGAVAASLLLLLGVL